MQLYKTFTSHSSIPRSRRMVNRAVHENLETIAVTSMLFPKPGAQTFGGRRHQSLITCPFLEQSFVIFFGFRRSFWPFFSKPTLYRHGKNRLEGIQSY